MLSNKSGQTDKIFYEFSTDVMVYYVVHKYVYINIKIYIKIKINFQIGFKHNTVGSCLKIPS